LVSILSLKQWQQQWQHGVVAIGGAAVAATGTAILFCPSSGSSSFIEKFVLKHKAKKDF